MIYCGTIVMANDSVYDASASGAENLTDLINYPPFARITSSSTTGTSPFIVMELTVLIQTFQEIWEIA